MKAFAVACLFTVSSSVFAQSWPTPAKTQDTPVTCTITVCAGKSVPSYSSPIVVFEGRYLDSQATRQLQAPVRTLRARTTRIVSEQNRIYMIVGSTMVAYDLSTFAARVAAPDRVNVTTLGAFNRGAFPEVFLQFNRYFYAESGWHANIFDPATGNQTDGDDRLYGFDYDDRGNVYVAYSPYGWGILDANLNSLHQGEVDAFQVLSVKVGARYYLIASSQNGSSRLYDVTDPSNPTRLSDLPFAVKEFAKLDSGAVAVIDGSQRLKLYSPAGLIAGTPARDIKATTGGFQSVTSDGTSVYALSCVIVNNPTPATVTIIGPSSTRVVDVGLRYGSVPRIRYGAGWLALFGQEAFVPGTDSAAAANLRLFRMTDGTPVPVPVLTTGGRQYFASVYSSTYAKTGGFASGMLASGIDAGSMGDAEIFVSGGKTYLAVAAVSLGDLYELQGAVAPPTPPVVVPPPVVPPPVTPPCTCPPPPPALPPQPPVVVPPPQPPPQPPTPPTPPCVCSREHLECCR